MILFYLNVITYTQPEYVTRVDPHTSVASDVIHSQCTKLYPIWTPSS